MSAKHTPGPWTVNPGFASAEVRGIDGELVAESLGPADAALCAASPELLSALAEMPCIICETAVGSPPKPLDIPGVSGCPGCQRARATLAKARGGA